MPGWIAHAGRVDTAHGPWWMAWTDRGLVASGRTLREVTALARAAGAGEVRRADPDGAPGSPDWSRLPGGFRGRVLRACHRIPSGTVMTYGDLARAAGVPAAARAAGSAMATNPLPVVIPCHRVVRADGALGDYSAGGTPAKARMLRAEGVPVRGARMSPLPG